MSEPKAKQETSDFIFLLAEKKLISVNKDSDLLDKKSFTIITMLLGILGLITSLSINNVIINPIPYVILLFGFGVSLFLLLKAAATSKYYGDSFKPSDILMADDYYLQSKDKLINGFLIDWYDQAIKKNQIKNSNRGRFINIATLVAMGSLALFLVFSIKQI